MNGSRTKLIVVFAASLVIGLTFTNGFAQGQGGLSHGQQGAAIGSGPGGSVSPGDMPEGGMQGGAGQQPPAGAAPQGQPPAGGGGMQEQSVEEEANDLASQLGLTEDQKTKVLEVLKDREKGVLKVREDFPVAKPGSSPSQEGIAAMDKVMNGATAKINAILNDEQKKKYAAIKSQQPTAALP